MEKENIEELECMCNYHSRQYYLYDDERDEHFASMATLQGAVKIFGYRFVEKGMAKSYREYPVYELVEINKNGG